jgi:predicted GTPase
MFAAQGVCVALVEEITNPKLEVEMSERNRTTQVVRSVHGKAVLVVSEYPEAGAGGATINFFMEQDKMRFSVSLAAASDAGVVISSTLLRLAKITDDKR